MLLVRGDSCDSRNALKGHNISVIVQECQAQGVVLGYHYLLILFQSKILC